MGFFPFFIAGVIAMGLYGDDEDNNFWMELILNALMLGLVGGMLGLIRAIKALTD